ncbi:MAG TPA: hypothetical protein VFN49_00555 [Candidatus Aquilonibacter sp.]|nr:hypothetical protein [Candidatus Aquilonibacter sp.]
MFVNAATERSLDLIASRASDVYKAFTPGATPANGDVETSRPTSRATADPLSVTAPPGTYFVTTDADGRTVYTRDGRLRVGNGGIVGSNGRAMLGYAKDDASLQALQFDAIDSALGRQQHLRVAPDGRVMYDRLAIEPRSGTQHAQPVCIGRLAVARFPAATKLSTRGDGTIAAPAGVAAHVGMPGDGDFGVLAPMREEQSRVDLDLSLERLHDAYVAFDALQAAHKAQGATGKVAMDLLK